MRSIPVEWNLFGVGPWDYITNKQNIYPFWVNGTIRARPYENVFTVGMRGDGDCELILFSFVCFSINKPSSASCCRNHCSSLRRYHFGPAYNIRNCLQHYRCHDYSTDVVSLYVKTLLERLFRLLTGMAQYRSGSARLLL